MGLLVPVQNASQNLMCNTLIETTIYFCSLSTLFSKVTEGSSFGCCKSSRSGLHDSGEMVRSTPCNTFDSRLKLGTVVQGFLQLRLFCQIIILQANLTFAIKGDRKVECPGALSTTLSLSWTVLKALQWYQKIQLHVLEVFHLDASGLRRHCSVYWKFSFEVEAAISRCCFSNQLVQWSSIVSLWFPLLLFRFFVASEGTDNVTLLRKTTSILFGMAVDRTLKAGSKDLFTCLCSQNNSVHRFICPTVHQTPFEYKRGRAYNVHVICRSRSPADLGTKTASSLMQPLHSKIENFKMAIDCYLAECSHSNL